MRIVRRIVAFLLIVGPIGGLIGVAEAGAAYPSTTTALSAVTASTTYGSETQTFTVTVSGDTTTSGGGLYGAPLGTVTVYAGPGATNELCSTSTLVSLVAGTIGADGTVYQCSDSETALDAGNYTGVNAVFVAGNPSSTSNGVTYNGSTSGTQTIGVNPDPVTTASIGLTISPGTVDVGAENVAGLFTVYVAGISGDGYPIGTGAVTLSPTAYCVPVRTGGTDNHTSIWTCNPTASQLTAGTYTGITATYTAPACPTAAPSISSTDTNYCYSNVGPSAGETLQVNTLEPTTSALVVAPGTIQIGNETTVVFTDTVTGVTGDGSPLGTVTVKSGSTTLCSNSSPTTSAGPPPTSVFVCSTTNGSALGVGPNQFVQAFYVPGAPGSSSNVTGFDYSASTGDNSLTVTAPPPVPPVITTPAGTLPDGTVGVPYSVTLSATTGTPPYNWTVPPGTLPPGLNLGPLSGQITGTPTTNGTYTFTVTVTDANSLTNSKTYTIVIGPALVITTYSLPSGNHGRPYSAAVLTSGGIAPLTFSISGGKLPPGLGINSATGRITGPAGAIGTYTFTVQVTDSTVPTPQIVTRTFTITIH